MFNSRVENSQLIDYLSQTNLFETIGKSRNEMTHSKMLRFLLSSREISSNSFSPLKHLLDAIVNRDSQQSGILDDGLRQSILTDSICINFIEECEVEYTLGNYVKSHSSNCNGFKDNEEKALSDKDKDRLDLYIRANIGGCKRKSLELFIENKVYSKEGDKQTERYYEVCKPQPGKGNGKESSKIFVYLTPISSKKLACFDQLDQKEKAGSGNYIQINYQDILDYIITPILYDSSLSERLRLIIKEYVNCLELPALPDAEIASAPKGFSIMATSKEEQNLVNKFMDVDINRTLINASVAVSDSEKLYQVNETRYLTADDAILLAVGRYIDSHGKWDSIRMFSDVIGKQGGDYPFLIYSCSKTGEGIKYLPYNYYVWDGEIFASVSDAFIALLPRYIEEGHSLSDFDNVYTGRGGGHLIESKPVGNFTECCLHDNTKCYVNNSCGAYSARINSVLSSKGFPCIKILNAVDYDRFTMQNQWCQKYPVVPISKYKRLGSTNFYYRRWGADIKKFISKTELRISEITDTKEYNLLKAFCENHKSLIISIKKILLDDIEDEELRNQEDKKLNNLMKQ